MLSVYVTEIPRFFYRPSPYTIYLGLKFYPGTFLFYQSAVLSSHAVDGYQMYFEGSVAGKALALPFSQRGGGSKSEKFGVV